VVSKPHLPASQIFSMCVGAFGIQFGFALPQANATRNFQNLGASLDNVRLLWLAGPITGLIIQPLVAMPNATTLWMAVLTLWVLVVGYDNNLLSRLSTPTLSTVQQDIPKAGRVLVSKLLEWTGDFRPEMLSTELIIRESCGA
jgi:hypothetical protein